MSEKDQKAQEIPAKTGWQWIIFGVAVFLVCNLIQHAFGSSMFSSSYSDPGLMGKLLINVTFWPGWLITIIAVLRGVMILVARRIS